MRLFQTRYIEEFKTGSYHGEKKAGAKPFSIYMCPLIQMLEKQPFSLFLYQHHIHLCIQVAPQAVCIFPTTSKKGAVIDL